MKMSRRLFMRSAPLMPVAAQQAAKEAALAAVQAASVAQSSAPIGGRGSLGGAGYHGASKQATATVAKLLAAGSRPSWRVAQDKIFAKRRAFIPTSTHSGLCRRHSRGCARRSESSTASSRKRPHTKNATRVGWGSWPSSGTGRIEAMPFVSRTRGSKVMGFQTYARAIRLPEELKGVELDYLSGRDWYMNQLSVKAQVDEELAQAKRAGDADRVEELGNRLNAIQSTLFDVRDRVRVAGERSWAEAFFIAAQTMLSPEAMRALSIEADGIIGRPRHELRGQRG